MMVRKRWINLAFFVGLALPIAAVFVLMVVEKRQEAAVFEPQMCVSADQIRKVGAAVVAYEKEHGVRPMKLGELVEAKLIDWADLFDAKRKWPAGRAPTTEPASPQADVLYFPGLKSTDGPELVLLCTLFTHDRDEPLLVVRNDGRFVEMRPHELVMALNRTYEQMAKRASAGK